MSYSKLNQDPDLEDIPISQPQPQADRPRRLSLFRNKDGGPIFHPSQIPLPQSRPTEILSPGKQHFVAQSEPPMTSEKTDSNSTTNVSPSTQLPEYSQRDYLSDPEAIPYGATNLSPLLPKDNSDNLKPAQKLSHKRKGSQNKVSFVISDTTERSIQTTEFAAGLVKRTKGKVTNKQLSIDTSAGPSKSTESFSSARSSSTSYFPTKPELEIIELSDIVDKSSNTLLSGNQNGKGRTQLSVAFQEYRFRLFQSLQPRTLSRLEKMSDLSDLSTIENFLKLSETLNLRPAYFDPELDILNRFCLEFESIVVKTDSTSFFTLRATHPIDRVYDYMDKRVNSISTPTVEQPVGPDVPVLLTQLFLNQFRVKSDQTNNINIDVPILSHSNRLSRDRFAAITRAVFDRRDFFYRNIDYQDAT